MNTKTIKLCGKDVQIGYCAATENAFENFSDKSIQVFVPTYGKDKDGKDIILAPAEAKLGDYVLLAFAGIYAAYSYLGEEPPITSNDLLYNIGSVERNVLIEAIIALRNEWYSIPAVVKENLTTETKETGEGENGKN